jgi:hypothetical protein
MYSVKVYCKDCKYIAIYHHECGDGPTSIDCSYPKNVRRRWWQFPWGYGWISYKKPAQTINRNNDCKWFEAKDV